MLDGDRLAVNGLARAALADRAHALVVTAQGDDAVIAVGVPTAKSGAASDRGASIPPSGWSR